MKKLVACLIGCATVSALAPFSGRGQKRAAIEVEQIDSVRYYALKKDVPTPHAKPEKITDAGQVKKMLAGRVKWGNYDNGRGMYEDPQGESVYEMTARNGETWTDGHMDFYYFIAYYPDEDIVLMEGGHTSDCSFDLTTGKRQDSAGNPDYIVASPSRQYRLSGYYGGQECSSWFIQEREGEKYRKTIQLDKNFEEITGVWLCLIHDAFWLNETDLYVITSAPEKGQALKLYYRIVL